MAMIIPNVSKIIPRKRQAGYITLSLQMKKPGLRQ